MKLVVSERVNVCVCVRVCERVIVSMFADENERLQHLVERAADQHHAHPGGGHPLLEGQVVTLPATQLERDFGSAVTLEGREADGDARGKYFPPSLF